MEDDRDSILDAAARRYTERENAVARAAHIANQPNNWPHPHSRVAAALRKVERYVSPNVMADVNDALQAMYVEQGGLDLGVLKTGLSEKKKFFKMEPDSVLKRDGRVLVSAELSVMSEQGDLVEAALKEAGFVVEDFKSKNIYERKVRDKYCHFEIEGDNPNRILQAVVDGYINKHYPEYAVDYKRILREETLGRSSKGEGRG